MQLRTLYPIALCVLATGGSAQASSDPATMTAAELVLYRFDKGV